MERELKKVPAYFSVRQKWFDCAAKAGMKSSQVGAALEYALACYLREPFELPEDPAARVLAAVMEEDVNGYYELVEQGKFPFFYLDENGDQVGEIQNASPEHLKEFEKNCKLVSDLYEMAKSFVEKNG